ncbi:MAG TPA: ligase-associated DNA damage response endonuclease PdeM [Chitinophagaceae bacterium]|nr:ligase-associated DNA damage response endonuclease PdeM [Chitinophagaceae bacterium]
MIIELNTRKLELLSEKAIYDAMRHLLIIADVHLGKAAHFRKEGIAIPAVVQNKDYERLARLFEQKKPLNVYFLGDLFHSHVNSDWHSFCALVRDFPSVSFTLVRGNHDLIDEALFADLSVRVENTVADEQFIFSHHPLPKVPEGKINLCGHIHPGIQLSGTSRQSLTLPCFYRLRQTFILPAFGALTGLYRVRRSKGDEVYGILPGGVRSLP